MFVHFKSLYQDYFLNFFADNIHFCFPQAVAAGHDTAANS